MGYVGNQQTEGYSQVPAKQDLTGATGTSLTLTHAVASAEGIDLFINNVRQEPTTAYSVGADGVTVTLTGSVVATDDIYVVYNSLARQTSTHPSNQHLNALSGTFSGGVSGTTGTFSGTVTANAFSGDGSALTGVSTPSSNPNVIINGAMQVWARGTSFTTSSNGTFSADRWASNAGASTVFSRSTDVPTGFHYSLSVAGSAYTGIRTRIEAADCKHIAGQEVTFSWYAKRTAGTGDMKTYLGYASAEDNFTTVTLIEEVVNTASASVSSDWARYTYTVTLPANVANGLHFVVFNGSASGAVTTLYTGVKLEKGDTATDFIHEDIGTTTRKCQRYYFQDTKYVAATLSTRAVTGTTYPVEMRAAPTITGGGAGFGEVTKTTFGLDYFQTATAGQLLTFNSEL